MSGRRKFRVRWWMWALLSLACIGFAIWGALAGDIPRAIFGPILALLYGFLAGVALMGDDDP